jgi:hypothetical protein
VSRPNSESLFGQRAASPGDKLELSNLFPGESFSLNKHRGIVLRRWGSQTLVIWQKLRQWLPCPILVTLEARHDLDYS